MRVKRSLLLSFGILFLLLFLTSYPIVILSNGIQMSDYSVIRAPWGERIHLIMPRGVTLLGIDYMNTNHISGFDVYPTIMIDRPPVLPFQFVLEGSGPTMYDVIEAVSADNTTLSGKNIVVGVVDTGIDFSAKGLGLESVAFTPEGVPLLLDADEFGLAITPLNVTANPYTRALNTSGSTIEVYIPDVGKALVNVDYDWVAPTITSQSGVYHFGFLVEYSFAENYVIGGSMPSIAFLVPVVLVDSNQTGVYDTVVADISSTWFTIAGFYYALGGILNPPEASLLDFSFADEKPLRVGEGVGYYDADGDNVSDFSIGVVSGFVYDAYGIINSSVVESDYLWENGWEPLGSGIYPGLDPDGRYVSFFYDALGHGTSVASIIGGRETKFFLPTINGLLKIEERGIAPDVKIAGAMALWNGNVLASLYWLSGHDYVNGTWVYTGKHRSDIISNSWGILYWQGLLLADGGGFSPGEDPLSYHLNRIAKHSIVVFAAGNEGPAKESIAMGGSSENVITVGASTVFGSPIYDSFGHLLVPSGLRDNVISWSSRGPVGLVGSKPDVVAPGAYALVPTAVNNGLGDGTRAIDVFGGTSMATPVVSGSLALLLEKIRGENNQSIVGTDFIKNVLMTGTDDLGYPPDYQGAGRINVSRTLELMDDNQPRFNETDKIHAFYENGRVYVPTSDYHANLTLYTLEQMYYETNITTEQYKELFYDIPLPSADYDFLTIKITSEADFIEDELPLAISWIGGWIDDNGDGDRSVDEIILCDHAVIAGRTITLHLTKKLVEELKSEGAIHNDSLTLYLFSASGLADSFQIKAFFSQKKIYSPTAIKGENLVFVVSDDMIVHGYSLGFLSFENGTRKIVEIEKPFWLANHDYTLNITDVGATHSSISGGLGDLYTIKLDLDLSQAFTEDGRIIGYVFSVPHDDVDLYIVYREDNYRGLGHIKIGFSSHPIGYLPSLEGFYPLPKISVPRVFVPSYLLENDRTYLLVYAIDDGGDGFISINVTPVVYREITAGSLVYYYISSNSSLGRIKMPDGSIVVHERGFVSGYYGYLGSGAMEFLDFPTVKFESKWLYGLETKSDYGETIVVKGLMKEKSSSCFYVFSFIPI